MASEDGKKRKPAICQKGLESSSKKNRFKESLPKSAENFAVRRHIHEQRRIKGQGETREAVGGGDKR